MPCVFGGVSSNITVKLDIVAHPWELLNPEAFRHFYKSTFYIHFICELGSSSFVFMAGSITIQNRICGAELHVWCIHVYYVYSIFCLILLCIFRFLNLTPSQLFVINTHVFRAGIQCTCIWFLCFLGQGKFIVHLMINIHLYFVKIVGEKCNSLPSALLIAVLGTTSF